MTPRYDVRMDETKVTRARTAVSHHQESRALEKFALAARDTALRELHSAGMGAGQIRAAIGGELSESAIRVILGKKA